MEERNFKEELKNEIIKEIKKDDSPGGLFIPAGVLLGIGFGFLMENFLPFLFIGLGAGFTFFAVYEIYTRKTH